MALLEQADPEERELLELPMEQALRSGRNGTAEEMPPEAARRIDLTEGSMLWSARSNGTEEETVAQAERRAAAESGGRSPAGDMVETLLESVTAGKAWEMWNRSGGAVRIGNGTREQMKLRYDGGEGAAALYGRVAAGQLRSTVEQRSGRVTVEMSEPATVAGVGIRELDRAFQKDARRYDGGLSLL